ncbi:hypothetical protein SO802_030624 [Lithocarpus litseifolius]|uniref:RNase H type-1 domain-containing protein n=1 Tax=Lithocarpus litseifolius TaxID=425828 RepID=A0AAW2BJE4_9ROSI
MRSWTRGFARNIGFTTNVMAEFWALRDGLLLALQMGINMLEVELDVKVVVDLVLASSTPNKAYSPLLNDCRCLIIRFQQVNMRHIFREANRCVDGFAKKGCT